MKRIISLVLVLILALSFAGCGQKSTRELYNFNLEKYVKIGEYKNITVDTKSKDFEKLQQDLMDLDVSQYNFYKGTVKEGDTANIDYIGKKDGVAFEGGTAQGYDLKIGSDSFIEGFEDGLIGAKVGDTVTLNLTFPENYDSEELAGEDVVFTVKVNYTDKKIKQEPKEYYKKLGYEKLDDYYAYVKQGAIEETIARSIANNAEIKDYPKKEIEKLYQFYYDATESGVKESYDIDMEKYFEYIGQTEEEFKESIITNKIKPLMEQQMVWYLIFDKEKMTLSEEDIDAKVKEIIARNGDSSITKADIFEQYGKFYIETLVISEKVFDCLKKNAKIS